MFFRRKTDFSKRYRVDLFANAHVYSTHVWVNALIMLLGVLLFAVGTGLYAAASLGRGSYEALTFSVSGKNDIKKTEIVYLLPEKHGTFQKMQGSRGVLIRRKKSR